VRVGDFVKLYSYVDPDAPMDDARVIDLVEHDGIVIKISEDPDPLLQVLWNQGHIEWLSASDVVITSNPDI
tara:strand:- start:72 stop:284 length:213 start_codon:yes stop_codon:yes gene_type:complete